MELAILLSTNVVPVTLRNVRVLKNVNGTKCRDLVQFVFGFYRTNLSSINFKYKYQVFALLGCYAASIGSYRRCETPYRFHLQGSSSPSHSSWTAWPLKMRPTGCPETSVTINALTSQKIKDLIYTAAEAWNHAKYEYYCRIEFDVSDAKLTYVMSFTPTVTVCQSADLANM